MDAEPVTEYVLTEHALFEMERRAITDDLVRAVLSAPEQRLDVRPGRVVLQSRVSTGPEQKVYLLRVLVDVGRDPAEVVTVYRTGKVQKYWRSET